MKVAVYLNATLELIGVVDVAQGHADQIAQRGRMEFGIHKLPKLDLGPNGFGGIAPLEDVSHERIVIFGKVLKDGSNRTIALFLTDRAHLKKLHKGLAMKQLWPRRRTKTRDGYTRSKDYKRRRAANPMFR